MSTEAELQSRIRVKGIQELHKEITHNLEVYNTALRNLQSICEHPNATKKGESDTGNWDRSQDSYWWIFNCPDCGKRWTEDQ